MNRAWRERNPEYEKQRYAANAEAFKTKSRKYTAENSDKVADYAKRYYAENAEKRKANKKQWCAENPEQAKAQVVRRRARKKGAEGSHTVAEWRALVAQFNGCCVCCGKHFGLRKLTRDHVIPLTWGGSDFIENIQPLCYSDNSRKRDLHATDYRPLWTAVS